MAAGRPATPAPVTVKVPVPLPASLATVRVSMELLPAVTVLGWKNPVTPGGSPFTESAIDCEFPCVARVETVVVLERPGGMISLDELRRTEKAFALGLDAVVIQPL